MASVLKEAKKKIVYVDDMNTSLLILKKALKEHYEIFLANSTKKMQKILKKIMPDLILLDVNMPDTDGYELIKILKTDKHYSSIPVIFITGNDDKESVQEGLKLGAAAYVIKPFNALKMIETINKILYPT
ncbi:MAG: response regulator [Treponema sp.]|nr:response regulator [Treponema sp.]